MLKTKEISGGYAPPRAPTRALPWTRSGPLAVPRPLPEFLPPNIKFWIRPWLYIRVWNTMYVSVVFWKKLWTIISKHAPFYWLFTFITKYFYNISYCVFRPIETTVSTLNLAWLLWHNKFDMIRTPHNLFILCTRKLMYV